MSVVLLYFLFSGPRLVLVLTRVLLVIVLQGSGGASCTWLCCVVTFSYSDLLSLLNETFFYCPVYLDVQYVFLFLILEALPVMCRVPGDSIALQVFFCFISVVV